MKIYQTSEVGACPTRSGSLPDYFPGNDRHDIAPLKRPVVERIVDGLAGGVLTAEHPLGVGVKDSHVCHGADAKRASVKVDQLHGQFVLKAGDSKL